MHYFLITTFDINLAWKRSYILVLRRKFFTVLCNLLASKSSLLETSTTNFISEIYYRWQKLFHLFYKKLNIDIKYNINSNWSQISDVARNNKNTNIYIFKVQSEKNGTLSTKYYSSVRRFMFLSFKTCFFVFNLFIFFLLFEVSHLNAKIPWIKTYRILP